MPELPEVETTVRGLNNTIRGKVFRDVWWDWKKIFRNIPPETLRKNILGKKVLGARRRAKNIFIDLSNGHTLLVHMKMTGHLMYGKWKLQKKQWVPIAKSGPLHDPFNRFIHVLWTFTDDSQLAFCDMRKFGKVEYVPTAELHVHGRISKLGPEPLERLRPEVFTARILQKPSGRIKTILMDQSVIAGIGNIYADEILWATGVHPESRVSAIPIKTLGLMCTTTKHILERSLKTGGDSKSDYRNIYGEKGGFQNFHRAYHQTGNHCTKKGCRGTIRRLVVGGRSAHYCDVHQKKYV